VGELLRFATKIGDKDFGSLGKTADVIFLMEERHG
jgi:hypothetical protein